MNKMGKRIATICCFVIASILAIGCFIGLGVAFMALDAKIEAEYYKSANWDCETDEEFLSQYKPLYERKIDELIGDIQLEKVVEVDEQNGIVDFYYYNDSITYAFHFTQAVGFALFKSSCYCYATNEMSLQDYEMQKQYVDILNQVINFCAYDVRGNDETFKNLFDKSVNENKNYESDYYHFDGFCGNVGYSVARNSENSSYYYKLQKDSDVKTISNIFYFEGILKQCS